MAISAAQLQVQVTSDVAAALSGLSRVNRAVSSTGNFLTNAAGTALGFVGGMLGLNAITGVVSSVGDSIFGLNSTLEGSSLALETMLGSSKAAGDQLNRLKQFAIATPFELPQLLEAQQRLLAFGFSVNDVIPLLTNLGDAAAGLNLGPGGLNRLITAVGQIQAKGRVQGDELLQLTEAGIPAQRILAEALGKTGIETQKLIEAGKVPADFFLAALRAFLRANFGGLMAKQARKLLGAIANIKDAVGFGLADAFKPLFDLVESLAIDLADFLQTQTFTDFVQRVRSGVQSLIQPLGTFLVMTGRIAQAHGLDLLHAGLVSLEIILGQVFGPNSAQTFHQWFTSLQALGSWLVQNVPKWFEWLRANLPGIVETAAGKFQEFAAFIQTNGPAALDVVIAKFIEWKTWLEQNIPVMVTTVLGAIASIETRIADMIANTRKMIEDQILFFSNLPLIGAALGPAAAAIQAGRPPPLGAAFGAAGGGGSAFTGGVTVNGPVVAVARIDATDSAQIEALGAQVMAAILEAASQAEPSPSVTLGGVLPTE
jgi:tape measure domain-containing protein